MRAVKYSLSLMKKEDEEGSEIKAADGVGIALLCCRRYAQQGKRTRRQERDRKMANIFNSDNK